LAYKRAESLYKEDLISEQSYDERRFAVERLRIELGKKTVTSPFDGVVIKKHVERGEWLSPGMTVATIADDTLMDVITDVPEEIARHCTVGMDALVRVGSSEITGKVTAVIPRGDISTRTFPVKIQISASSGLMEGMEATVALPLGAKQEVLTVDRDAVISMYGETVVFAVIDSKAMKITVQVIGYEGSTAGIAAEGLSEGMQLVIKGNERLRPDQPVMIQE
jgi:membrane fusion protein (multidrug efflux system)